MQQELQLQLNIQEKEKDKNEKVYFEISIPSEYNKLLKTRNEYLKVLFNNNIADKTYLDIITDNVITIPQPLREFNNSKGIFP